MLAMPGAPPWQTGSAKLEHQAASSGTDTKYAFYCTVSAMDDSSGLRFVARSSVTISPTIASMAVVVVPISPDNARAKSPISLSVG